MAIFVFWTVCLIHLCNQVRMTSAVTNFTLTTNRVTWNTAKTICEQSGERLAKIDSDEIQEFVQNGWINHDQFWIGLFEQDDVFKWSDDCAEYQHKNWATGEPSTGVNKPCVSVSPTDGVWKTDVCNERHMFICEKPESGCVFSDGIDGYIGGVQNSLSFGTFTDCYNNCVGSTPGFCWAFAYSPERQVCQIYFSDSPLTVHNANILSSNLDYKTYLWTCQTAFIQSVTIDDNLIDDSMQPVTKCLGNKRTTETLKVSSTVIDEIPTSGPVTAETITTVQDTRDTQSTSTAPIVPTEEDTTTNTPGNDVTISLTVFDKDALTSSGHVTADTVTTVQETRYMQSPSSAPMVPTEEDTTTNTPGNDVTITQTISYKDGVTSSCVCSCQITYIPTNESKTVFTARIIKELDVPKTSVSSYKRKHISAPDNRLMARGIGYAGAAFLAIVFGSLILLDIPRLAQDINRLRKTIIELFRKK